LRDNAELETEAVSRKKKHRRNAPHVEHVWRLTLPPFDVDSLHRFHRRLSAHLTFPCAAYIPTQKSRRRETFPVLVRGLRPVEEADLVHGILVEIGLGEEARIVPLHEINLTSAEPAAAVVLEYLLWFDSAWEEDEAASDEESLFEPEDDMPRDWLRPLLRLSVQCAGAGAVVSAILTVVEGAKTAAIIGAAMGSFLGLLAGMWYGGFAALHRPPLRRAVFGLFGLIGGVLLGGMVGGVAMAYVGSIPGSIAGALMGRWLCKADSDAAITWGIAWAFLGGLAYALWLDTNAALAAAGVGLLLGLGGGVVLILFLVVVVDMLFISDK
jgi:hypothetical protein